MQGKVFCHVFVLRKVCLSFAKLQHQLLQFLSDNKDKHYQQIQRLWHSYNDHCTLLGKQLFDHSSSFPL